MTVSVKAKNAAVGAPGMLWVYALCIDVLILSWLCDQTRFFCVLLLLPSGLGDVPVETLTDFHRAESKSLRQKWTHKGCVKCIGKPEMWHLESFHCSDKMTLVCCCCFWTCRQTGCMWYLYISHLHDVFYSVIFFSLGELGANDKLFFILGNTAENSWIIYFMHFSLVYLDACKLTL